jgi:hypothetical protein
MQECAGSPSTRYRPSSRFTPSMPPFSSTPSAISTRLSSSSTSPVLLRVVRPRCVDLTLLAAVSSPFSSSTCTSSSFPPPRLQLTLLSYHSGGERSLIITLHGRPPHPHPRPIRWLLPPMDASDPFTFLALKRGILRTLLSTLPLQLLRADHAP